MQNKKLNTVDFTLANGKIDLSSMWSGTIIKMIKYRPTLEITA